MTNLEKILQNPYVQKALNLIAEAAAPDTAPMPKEEVADAMATLQREETAAKIRNALETLGVATAELDRAAGLERLAGRARGNNQLPRQQPQEQITITTKITKQEEKTEEKKSDRRGGIREGAGRKPKEATEKKAEAKLITLYPEEWKQLDQLAKKLNIKRPGVIRFALKTLAETLNEKENTN